MKYLGSAVFTAYGTRIFELDAVTVPEPATPWIMLAAPGAQAWKFRTLRGKFPQRERIST